MRKRKEGEQLCLQGRNLERPIPLGSIVGTHGLRAFGENRKKATVLVGRNPTLPGFPLQGTGMSIEDFPYVKKKEKKRYRTNQTLYDNQKYKRQQ